MIIVVAALVGIVVVRVAGADLRRLSSLPIRHLWMVWLAIGVQVGVLSFLADDVDGWVGRSVHLATYGVAIAFLVVNRTVHGMPVIMAGACANLAAIVANGGVMPASATAWRFAGRARSSGFSNSLPIVHPRLLVLGDVFALPAGWPLANVFSIGDVLIVWGLVSVVSHWCRRPVADGAISEARDRPFADR